MADILIAPIRQMTSNGGDQVDIKGAFLDRIVDSAIAVQSAYFLFLPFQALCALFSLMPLRTANSPGAEISLLCIALDRLATFCEARKQSLYLIVDQGGRMATVRLRGA